MSVHKISGSVSAVDIYASRVRRYSGAAGVVVVMKVMTSHLAYVSDSTGPDGDQISLSSKHEQLDSNTRDRSICRQTSSAVQVTLCLS